ncbi:MvaI/BcnI family restriction endonuclease [Terrabacter sp. RAF57]|uniref:MvaI/BcnI family restriction endonuclease n=1 Tax=Terrabacter sp. RAF57 TaxID=3233063 RepID=UPI003F98A609
MKFLPPRQDNDKNQIYLGKDLAGAASLLPYGHIKVRVGGSQKVKADGRPIYHADVRFAWLLPFGGIAFAPHAKLTYHPQYPEVRLSGLIEECTWPPRSMYVRSPTSQVPGRVLVLGVAGEQVFGLLLPPTSLAARELADLRSSMTSEGVLYAWPFAPTAEPSIVEREVLLGELHGVAQRLIVPGCRIDKSGTLVLTNAPNAGGATLEAQLGLQSNPQSRPDFYGWELKAHVAKKLDPVTGAGSLTLFTSEPSGGRYKKSGFDDFMRAYGHENPSKVNRYNHAGTLRVGSPFSPKNQTRLVMVGYNGVAREHDPDGYLALESVTGDLAASWTFADLLDHWRKKHARAAYVPYLSHPSLGGYQYGTVVRIGEGASFLGFLTALAEGRVLYDPGSWLLHDGTGKKVDEKRRNQFRIQSTNVHRLYTRMLTLRTEAYAPNNDLSSRNLRRLGVTLPRLGALAPSEARPPSPELRLF